MTCVKRIDVTIGDPEDPFVISSTCEGAGVQWTQLALPEWSLRMKYAPPSDWVSGNVLLAAVEDSGEMAMVVTLEADSIAALNALKTQVKNALTAWPGEVTITVVEDENSTVIDGPWQSFPTVPRWGEVTALLRGAYLLDGSFSIPVNPAGAP